MKQLAAAAKITTILLLLLFYSGCTGDSSFVDFQFSLSPPEVKGRQVTVNGGVGVPIERIQWEWGDGEMEKHHFFPCSHTYNNPGRYEIKVTVFDSKNQNATRTVTVDIK